MRRAVADGHDADCLTRFAGGGSGDDRPGDAGRIRSTFAEASQRNMALGLWAAVGSGGAAFGPLVGGILLEHFYWGSVFLINVPIVLVVIAINAKVVPRQPARREQPLNLLQALVLIAAILMLVFSAKSALKGQLALWLTALVALGGAAMLTWFIRKQLSAARPMVDMRLFTHRIILSGVMMAMTALITLVGFELLMAQELQFVHQKTPFEAGIFMLPVMVASGFSGPIAACWCRGLGCARWRPAGCCSAPSASRPGVDRFQYQQCWPGG
ncbi:methyl viologen resistance protein SmvA [Klebsiella pneumoniae]|uniref:Methyl viologen resistance protein SmvA n=1 Tax=Klebsiella pneumoniae TaxID=573 RepID=A0A2X3GZM2_KLEPN|nr:methyl viologen resistance protein SmvA [Klebsiella pneumoniae]